MAFPFALALIAATGISRLTAAPSAMADEPPAPPACTPAMVAFTTSLDGGQYDGMSHSGLRAILTNTSKTACLLSRIPKFAFYGDRGGPLAIEQGPPIAMHVHPGPVMVPIALPAGARANSVLRWVSGDVYAGGHCANPTRIAVLLGAPIFAPAATQLCGAAVPAKIGFDAENWHVASAAGSPSPAASP